MAPDAADAPSVDEPSDYYELTYRATRAALWDVLGTATFALFLAVVGLLGFYALVVNALVLADGGGNSGHVAVLILGALALAVAAGRLYRLYRG
jgi:hypothetical protein